MKDLTKKLLCLLVALAMVFVLCACGGNDKDDDDDDDKDKDDKKPTTSQSTDEEEEDDTALDSMEGNWKVTFDYAALAQMMSGGEDVDEATASMLDAVDAEFTLIFSFTDDEVSLLADPDDLEDFVKDVAKDLMAWYEDGGLEETLGIELTDEELEEYLDSMREEVENADVESLFGELEKNDDGMYMIGEASDYSFDGEVLEIDGEELEISYKNGTITVESASGDAAFMEGLKLKKQ